LHRGGSDSGGGTPAGDAAAGGVAPTPQDAGPVPKARLRVVPGIRLGPLPRIRPPHVPRPRAPIRLRRIAPFLAVLGPGLIAGVAGNDAGGITTYSVMGATTGYTLLWLFPITAVVLGVVQEMAARLGTVSGQGLSDLIRDRFGVRWTLLAMGVLLLANLANTVAEFAGASAALGLFGIPTNVTVPVLAIGLWLVVMYASYRRLEKLFLLLSLVFVTYVAAAVLSHPDWSGVGYGLTHPSLSVPGMGTAQVLLLAVAMVGTTITPYMQFYLQSAVAEKGIGVEDLAYERADAVVGSVWTNAIAFCIVLATAAALFGSGVHIDAAADAAVALRPVAGDLSTTMFGIGLFGASMLAAVIMPVSTAFVICEAFGWESGVGKPVREAPAFFGLFTFVLLVGAVVTLIPGLDLIAVIVGSQYLQGLLLPIVLVFMLVLVNDRRTMGANANGRLLNTLGIASVARVPSPLRGRISVASVDQRSGRGLVRGADEQLDGHHPVVDALREGLGGRLVVAEEVAKVLPTQHHRRVARSGEDGRIGLPLREDAMEIAVQGGQLRRHRVALRLPQAGHHGDLAGIGLERQLCLVQEAHLDPEAGRLLVAQDHGRRSVKAHRPEHPARGLDLRIRRLDLVQE